MKLESTFRYLSIEADDALKISAQIEIQNCPATTHTLLYSHFLARYCIRAIGHNRKF